MLDIIVLYFLTKGIGTIAEQKGLKPSRWKLYVVLAWFIAYAIGINIGEKIYNLNFEDFAGNIGALVSSRNFIMVCLIGWGFAVASYFTVRDILQRKADIKSKHYDINQHTED